ncbi:MAG: NAD-dependent epimerase/dehydratase family protein [Fibrobacterota bacterium]|nr:NAD-dependent epimerase/dehydratase family protein [Fibrobacterota bacterium]QQS07060.1 MAG: NAD-dependent epimerase/dehydratase family protein [Fibrobacterota bacterium]
MTDADTGSVLVTGAGGFLGSHLCRHFAREGRKVWAVGRNLSRKATLGGWASLLEGVVELELPSSRFARKLAAIQPDLVVHCASSASVPLSMKDPRADLRQSTGVYGDILEAVRTESPRTEVILLSSAAVYGQPHRIPTPEDEPPAPVSPYGFHKWMCELLSREYAEIYGIRTTNLRIFSAYGESLYKQVVFDTLSKLADPSRDEIELYGTGEETRDFIHASDIAQAVLRIQASGATGTFNVASGRSTSIRRLVELLNGFSSTPKKLNFKGESRPGDPDRWCADISKLASTGFRPLVELEDGLRRVTDWFERLQRTLA